MRSPPPGACRTLSAWRPELLAYFTTNRATSNGPTEAINLLIETSRRAGYGFRNFNNYRLRLLLAHGATTCDHGAPRIGGVRDVVELLHGFLSGTLDAERPVRCVASS